MAGKLDPQGLVTIENQAISNMWENAAPVKLLERQGILSHHGSGEPRSSTRPRTKVCHTTRVSPVEAEFPRFDRLGMSGIAFCC